MIDKHQFSEIFKAVRAEHEEVFNTLQELFDNSTLDKTDTVVNNTELDQMLQHARTSINELQKFAYCFKYRVTKAEGEALIVTTKEIQK